MLERREKAVEEGAITEARYRMVGRIGMFFPSLNNDDDNSNDVAQQRVAPGGGWGRATPAR